MKIKLELSHLIVNIYKTHFHLAAKKENVQQKKKKKMSREISVSNLKL